MKNKETIILCWENKFNLKTLHKWARTTIIYNKSDKTKVY